MPTLQGCCEGQEGGAARCWHMPARSSPAEVAAVSPRLQPDDEMSCFGYPGALQYPNCNVRRIQCRISVTVKGACGRLGSRERPRCILHDREGWREAPDSSHPKHSGFGTSAQAQ